MKKAAYTLLLIFALLLPLVAAEAPTLLYNVDINGTTGGDISLYEIDDTHLAIAEVQGTQVKFNIVNPTTGQITDTATIGGVNRIVGIDHTGTTIAVCTVDRVSPGFAERVDFFRKPSDQDGFLSNLGSSTYSSSDSGYDGCIIDQTSSTRGQVFVQNFGKTFTLPDRDGRYTVYFNGSGATLEELPVDYTSSQYYHQNYDEENNVFHNAGDFISNDNPENHTGATTDSLALGDYTTAWNHDRNNPLWVTNNGHIVYTDDYNDILESSGSITADQVVAVKSAVQVFAVINGTWYTGDFTNAATPTLTSEGVDIPDYADSYTSFYTTTTRIYHFNSTSGKLTTWQYQEEQTCSATQGCYIDDNFNYGDTVLNHGWTGTSVAPVDGELECYNNAGRYNRYYFTPITAETGEFFLEFDATMCGQSTAWLELALFSNNDVAFQNRMKADSLEGTIQDHNWDYVTYDIGDNASDDDLFCTPVLGPGFKRFENSYKYVFHPQNNPKTYDLYINDVLVSQSNEWTTVGQNLLSINNFGISGSPSTPYCYWRVDNVNLYRLLEDEQLTEEAILEARNTIGGIEMSLDTQFHFDRDDHCEVTENTQLCFLRWAVGGLLDWFWRLIVNNPLQSLAFIFVAVVLVVAGHNARKK